MPYDGNVTAYQQRIATKAEFWAATPRERLAMLAYALRHMPETHQWHFPSVFAKPRRPKCNTAGCAIGLAQVVWGASFDSFPNGRCFCIRRVRFIAWIVNESNETDGGERMTARVLHLPLPPPLSACFANARGPGRVKTKRYEAWINEAIVAAMQQSRPTIGPWGCAIIADYQFGKPDNRKQDVENRAKAVSDLLVRAGILVDDSQIIDLRLRWADVEGVVVTISPAVNR